MIIFEKKEQHSDEEINGALIRRYANTIAEGYLSALNITPLGAIHADLLTVDVVLTEYPKFLAGKFDFEYSDRRTARRSRGLGKFAHLHLSVSDEQLNYLISQVGKKITIGGDEIAIQRNGGSWFFVDQRSLEWLGLPVGHELSVNALQILSNAPADETQCHSIILRSLNSQSQGSGMSGHFASAAAGVTGFGGQIAKNSVDKAGASLSEKIKRARERRSEGKTRDQRNSKQNGGEK